MLIKLKASVQVTALAGYFPTAVPAVVMEEVPLRHEGIDNEVLSKGMPTAAGVLSEQRAGPSGVSWWHDACAKTQGHHGPPQGGCRQVRARSTGQGLWCNSTTDSGTQSHLPGGHCRGGGMRSSLQALGGTPTRPHYVSS